MAELVQLITDDDGEAQNDQYWHLLWSTGNAATKFCDGHVIGSGESIAKYRQKKGRITCPECRKELIALRKVSLK